jgi:hypothetical protein
VDGHDRTIVRNPFMLRQAQHERIPGVMPAIKPQAASAGASGKDRRPVVADPDARVAKDGCPGA